MVDIAQPRTTHIKHAGFSKLNVDTTDLLVLEGELPVMVYVRQTTNTDGKTIAEFASASSGPFFTGGIFWASKGDHALFVTFSLTSPVLKIECDLPYSPTHTPAGSTTLLQDLCILPAFHAKVDYHFFVKFSDGSAPYDPKIVVTPIDAQTAAPRSRKA